MPAMLCRPPATLADPSALPATTAGAALVTGVWPAAISAVSGAMLSAPPGVLPAADWPPGLAAVLRVSGVRVTAPADVVGVLVVCGVGLAAEGWSCAGAAPAVGVAARGISIATAAASVGSSSCANVAKTLHIFKFFSSSFYPRLL